MAIVNPYMAPQANVASREAKQFGEESKFSVSGRRGRMRYIGYSTGLAMLIGMLLPVASEIVGPSGAIPLTAVGWILMLVSWRSRSPRTTPM